MENESEKSDPTHSGAPPKGPTDDSTDKDKGSPTDSTAKGTEGDKQPLIDGAVGGKVQENVINELGLPSLSRRGSNAGSTAPSILDSLAPTVDGKNMSLKEAKNRWEVYMRKVTQYGGDVLSKEITQCEQISVAFRLIEYQAKLRRATERYYQMLRQRKKRADFVPLQSESTIQGVAKALAFAEQIQTTVNSRPVVEQPQNELIQAAMASNVTSNVLEVPSRYSGRGLNTDVRVQEAIDRHQTLHPPGINQFNRRGSMSGRPEGNRVPINPSPDFVSRLAETEEPRMGNTETARRGLPLVDRRPTNRVDVERILVDPSPEFYSRLPKPWNTLPDQNARSSDVLKQIELQKGVLTFDGDLLNYPVWRCTFLDLVHRQSVPLSLKAIALKTCLSEKDPILSIYRRQVSSDPRQYAYVVTQLEEQFGGPERVTKACRKAIEDLPRLRGDDIVQLQNYRATIYHVYTLLDEIDRKSEVDNMGIHELLLRQTSRDLQIVYFRHCQTYSLAESTSAYLTWLDFEIRALQRDSSGCRGRRTTALATMGEPSEPTGKVDALATNQVLQAEHICPICKKEHFLRDCPIFLGKNTKQRRKFIKDERRCFMCLRKGHNVKDCLSNRKCKDCGKPHHHLLHNPGPDPQQAGQNVLSSQAEEDNWYLAEDCFSDGYEFDEVEETSHNTQISVLSQQDHGQLVLPYAAVFVASPGGKWLPTYALLDTCSSATIVTTELAEQLALVGPPVQLSMHTINGTTSMSAHQVQIRVGAGPDPKHSNLISALAVGTTFTTKKLHKWSPDQLSRWPHLVDIDINTHSSIEMIPQMLIGIDNAELFLPSKIRRANPGDFNAPVAFHCALGWVIYGRSQTPCHTSLAVDITNYSSHFELVGRQRKGIVHLSDSELTEAIDRLWQLEDGVAAPPTLEERYALQLLEQGWQLDEDHRLTLPVLWKPNEPNFESNYSLARSRLISSERKADRNSDMVRDEYEKIITQYLEKGYAREVMDEEKTKGKYYIPHFPVIRLDHETTKVRVVMDAKAKFNGKSLNDAILPGPSLIGDLVCVLLRFRKESVAISGDVSQMFLRIKMPECDRPYHRWLYRAHPLDQTREFEMISHVFGNAGSPCVAMYAAQENARRYFGHKAEFSRAVEAVTKSTIMDDTLYSVPTAEEALDLASKLTEMYEHIGMTIHKFASSDRSVMEALPASIRSKLCDKDFLWGDHLTTLGLRWDANCDQLAFILTHPTNWEAPTSLTKRILLQSYMRLFDPLGLLLPFIIQARVIFRRCWQDGYSWDEELSQELQSSWNEWREDCAQKLVDVKIPRHLNGGTGIAIHVFADASSDAYAACAYVVNLAKGTSYLAHARGKVSPVKGKHSIPRLELQACQLALMVAKKVCHGLDHPLANVLFWTDSKANLYWFRTTTRQLQTFVANRVEAIMSETSVEQWRWVPGESNPADLASRGHRLPLPMVWFIGPEFLLQSKDKWPVLNDLQPADDARAELVRKYREQLTCSALQTSIDTPLPRHECISIAWERCSDLNRLINGLVKLDKSADDLSIKQQKVKNMLLRQVQLEVYEEEIQSLKNIGRVKQSSKLACLSPILDTNGIIRVNGRLKNMLFGNPVVLPPHHPFTRLTIAHLHKDGHHSIGPEQVLAKFRETYHSSGAKSEARRVHRNCVTCRRLHGKPMSQQMAPLPPSRVPEKPGRAFQHTSMDIGGPYYVRGSQKKQQVKRWFVIFSCFQTRAVHLEHLTCLTADEFLLAFSRFTGRRGFPETLYMDNAQTFQSASKKLAQLLSKQPATKTCKFIFAPPYGPHFNGSAERMVQATKKALRGLMTAGFKDEAFRTALVVAEGLINSRPLTLVSPLSEDLNPLTPAHFLGQAPYRDPLQYPDRAGVKHRWLNFQAQMNKFWQRLLKEYTTLKHTNKKWQTQKPNLEVGDVVLAFSPPPPKQTQMSDNKLILQAHSKQRGVWPLGIVMSVNTGKDGKVRDATVRLSSGTEVRRPVTQLVWVLRPQQNPQI